MNKSGTGCTFGLVLEQKVKDNKESMQAGFTRVLKELDGIKKENKQMFNHISERPTKEAARNDKIMWAIIGGMGSVILTLVGLMAYGARVA